MSGCSKSQIYCTKRNWVINIGSVKLFFVAGVSRNQNASSLTSRRNAQKSSFLEFHFCTWHNISQVFEFLVHWEKRSESRVKRVALIQSQGHNLLLFRNFADLSKEFLWHLTNCRDYFAVHSWLIALLHFQENLCGNVDEAKRKFKTVSVNSVERERGGACGVCHTV